MGHAVFLEETGGPEKLMYRAQELEPPGAGMLRVRHTAVGVNFIDIYQRKGLYPVSLPAILGGEAAGVVETAGEGVEGFAPGDRIAWLGAGGGYAQSANIPAIMAVKLPDVVSDEIAASTLLKGLTVSMLLQDVFALRAEHSCLVYAAAGGVGTLLCQWAREIGAHVIGVVGTPAKAASALENGASDVIIRSQTENISDAVRKLTNGRGVDVVYDSVGAATFDASLDSLAVRGHMVSFGNASGPVPPVAPLALSTRGSLTLTRPTLFHYATPDRLSGMAKELFDRIAGSVLKPRLGERFSLRDASGAHRALESGETMGAIVLTPEPA